MKKFCFVVFLVFLGVNSAPGNGFPPDADTAPEAFSGAAGNQSDLMWSLHFNFSAEALTGDNGIIGTCWDGRFIWISGRGVSPNPNMIYIVNHDGDSLITSFPAGSNSAWGVRDLCTDGVYIYGGWEEGIIQYDPSPLPAQPAAIVRTIPFPPNLDFPRGSCYCPIGNNGQGSFFCANFSSEMYEIDTNGYLLRQLGPGPAAYGLAYDYDAPDGPWIWIFSQSSAYLPMMQFDPVAGQLTGYVRRLSNIGMGEIAGGCEYIRGWNPEYSTLMVVIQGTPDCAGGFEMYGIPYNHLNIILSRHNPQGTIPAAGGWFEFRVYMYFPIGFTLDTDIWDMMILPDSSVIGPGALHLNVPYTQLIGPLRNISRPMQYYIPARAPAGDYTYNVFAGIYPDSVYHHRCLSFEKLAAGEGGPVEDWNITWGEGFEGLKAATDRGVPLVTVSPNPFNAETVIGFELQEPGRVSLVTYDAGGREAARLIEGWQPAGIIQARWNAEDFPSGVYFCRLMFNKTSVTRKILLVK